MRQGKMNIVFGGQAGSEAKGKMSAYLVDKFDIRYIAGNLSPNAGHTVVKDGKKIVTHHIPAGIVGTRNMEKISIFLGHASAIDIGVLKRELELIEELRFWDWDLWIGNRAAVVTEHQINTERNTLTVIGSTAQGVGEARAAKLRRRGERMGQKSEWESHTLHYPNHPLISVMSMGTPVLCEMAQGFDLCIDHGVDPVYCTSRNCTPMQAFADMGIPIKYAGDTYAVIRPYPIRVNNRDGSSGPYPSKEITWNEIRIRCDAPWDITEFTTTTKLERRVFEFSWSRIREMIRTCDPTYLCLQFANYIDWRCHKARDRCGLGNDVMAFVEKLEDELNVPVAYVGTGPEHEDMVDMEVDK